MIRGDARLQVVTDDELVRKAPFDIRWADGRIGFSLSRVDVIITPYD